MPLPYAQNKKHVYKWIENNRRKLYDYQMSRYSKDNYDDKKRESKMIYYNKMKIVGNLRYLPFYHSDQIIL